MAGPSQPLNDATHDIFGLENEDTKAQLQLRRPVQERLEAQYRRWQDHEQHLWREAISSSSTQSILGLDNAFLLEVLQRNITNNTLGLSLLSELELCSVRPSTVRSYESRRNIEAAQWLHHQYRRYAVWIKEFEEGQKQYSIPLLDLTVLAGDDHLLFEQRSREDASRLLPPALNSRRFVFFPQTRYAFLEDEVFQPMFPVDEEQFRLMSSELLPHFRGTAGFYNALSSPFTYSFSQPSYDGSEIRYIAAMYPVVNFESLADYKNRKASESNTFSMQKYGSSGLPAIARARYARRFDFPRELTLSRQDDENGGTPEKIHSGRALFEFACGDVDTIPLDQRQISILEGSERHPTRPPHLLTIEPLWIIAFPTKDTLCAFYDNGRDGKPEDLSRRIANRTEGEKEQDWARTFIQLVEAADQYMGRYEPIYRVWLAKLRIKIQASQRVEPSLVRTLSDFVAEVTILLDPLQKQIAILASWLGEIDRNFPASRTSTTKFNKKTSDMVREAIASRKLHLELLQRLLQQGKDTQALLFQLSNIETSYLQSELAKKMARETYLQSKLAKHAQRQNKSILTFTIITVIFLPLSFFTSYFGMNTRDIRQTGIGQTGFWAVAAPISFVVISSALLIAFRLPILKWHRGRKGGQGGGQSIAQKQDSELGDDLEGVLRSPTL